jgi:nitroreductase
LSTTNDLKRGLEAVGLALETDPGSAPAILDAMQGRLDASRVRQDTREAWQRLIDRARAQATKAARKSNPPRPAQTDRDEPPRAHSDAVTAAVRVYTAAAAVGLDTSAALALLVHVAPDGLGVSELVHGIDAGIEEARQITTRDSGLSPRSRT